jgi:hypothetical protein
MFFLFVGILHTLRGTFSFRDILSRTATLGFFGSSLPGRTRCQDVYLIPPAFFYDRDV